MLPCSDPLLTQRQALLQRLQCDEVYDLVVVGGGATGLGVALEAAVRGLRVALVEAHDFAKGTSSRATKLVHGGVRYLAQGQLGLVNEALHERATLLRNAAHLAQPLAFVVPAFAWWELPFYGAGLVGYDLLAGRAGLGHTELLGPSSTRGLLPGVQPRGLKGGVLYWDGQFDDARMALALARTAALHGADLLNYCAVVDLQLQQGRLAAVVCEDAVSGLRLRLRTGCVINATGVWVDGLRGLEQAALRAPAPMPLVAPSQGVHLTVDREFLGGDAGLMVPKTRDGRVLFAVPWLGKVLLGTTDTPRHDLPQEPRPLQGEVGFILEEAARYLARPPRLADVRSIWVGLRPLVRPPDASEGGATKGLSREHTVQVSATGMVTVTGGKWTTYRAMAHDVLQTCLTEGLVPGASAASTADLPLVGAPAPGATSVPLSAAPGPHLWGSEQGVLSALPGADDWLCPGLSVAMVHFAALHEYAVRVEDVLARRSRLLFLDAALAAQVAPRVATVLQALTGIDPQLADFVNLACQFRQPLPAP